MENWQDLFTGGYKQISIHSLRPVIEELYRVMKLPPPKILCVDSPLAIRIEIVELKKLGLIKSSKVILRPSDLLPDFHEVERTRVFLVDDPRSIDKIVFDIHKQVEQSMLTKPLERLQIGIGISSFRCLESLESAYKELRLRPPPKFELIKKICLTGIYEALLLRDYCFISLMPSFIKTDEGNRLHSPDSPAVKFNDGYKLFFWHGVSIPSRWIDEKKSINWETIYRETNTERRRCLREILGIEKYFELIGGVNLVDADKDGQSNEMKLFVSRRKDPFLKVRVQYLEVICPSTHRKYILYPPNQRSRNVWDAKASTFSNEKIQFRHGDVGLLNLEHCYHKPKNET